MSDAPLSHFDEKHIRNAWIWAATIIAIAVLSAVGGLFAQLTNQGSGDTGRDTVESAARAQGTARFYP
jgi:hypothetical protein